MVQIDELIRHMFYNEHNPEFTAIQQTCWTIVLAIVIGLFTALWRTLVLDTMISFLWRTVPRCLLNWGVFTDMDGHLPLVHYMWICPAFFTGLLTFLLAKYRQTITNTNTNSWIQSINTRGIILKNITDNTSNFNHAIFILFLSTIGMSCGLSLAPETPLLLLSGIIGSYLSLCTKQSVLSARVINLVTASAAMGGFFAHGGDGTIGGFNPLVGALFVLELPHRRGVMYFEALSVAIVSSTVSFFVNRVVLANVIHGDNNNGGSGGTSSSDGTDGKNIVIDVNRNQTMILLIVLASGLYGKFIGQLYTRGCLTLKQWVERHILKNDNGDFDEDIQGIDDDTATNCSGDDNNSNMGRDQTVIGNGHKTNNDNVDEETLNQPLTVETKRNDQQKIGSRRENSWRMAKPSPTSSGPLSNNYQLLISSVGGFVIGATVGLISMFLPHELFWGQAQLQTLMNKGQTPLPVFEYDEGDDLSLLTHYGFCMIGYDINATLSTGCMCMIGIGKIITIGLSLGTGICGGHFFGPLFVGCALSHLLSDGLTFFFQNDKETSDLMLGMMAPMVVLCTMGSTHISVFRCYLAIVILLGFLLSSFSSTNVEISSSLLVAACLLPYMAIAKEIFYKEQGARGDISAIPHMLVEASKYQGTPMHAYSDDSDDESSASESSSIFFQPINYGTSNKNDSFDLSIQ